MKKRNLLAGLMLALAMVSQAQVREHRAVWWTPFLGDWPSKEITQSNYTERVKVLNSNLDNLINNNINIVYFHCRSTCDATYDSKYEPWSEKVSSARGAVPYGDPFRILIENAHAKGIEVYAWVNPYRYCNTGTPSWGTSPLDYENSHPEWLISNGSQNIINPGLPEVQQRICDVIEDIITKYDCDGVVFDDYFYSNPTSMSVDADLYNAYVNAVGKDKALAQADWRRKNVNDMVAKVYATIKRVKPYLKFGISPAGPANHPASAHPEIPACNVAGYQYNGIYSDPVAWMKAKSVDYISPQIYWPLSSTFGQLTDWWGIAEKYFGVPVYTSQTMQNVSTEGIGEQIAQTEYTRSVITPEQSGVVYFDYSTFISIRQKYNGDPINNLYNIVGKYAFPTYALAPLTPWKGERKPIALSNVRREGNTLRWNDAGDTRYAVYAIPATVDLIANAGNPDYLTAVRYTNEYEIPEDLRSCNFAVAAYDRYSYLYSPYTAGGAAATPVAAKPTTPENGGKVTMFGALQWETSAAQTTLIVAKDPQMKEVEFMCTRPSKSYLLSDIPAFDQSITHYWQVIAHTPNAAEKASEVRSFSIDEFTIDAPASPASYTPLLTWKALGPGVEYKLVISERADLSSPKLTYTTTENKYQVKDGELAGNVKYYIGVTATRGNISLPSNTANFTTAAPAENAVPEFVSLSQDGMTLHCDDKIAIKPIAGAYTYRIEIAASSSFPARSLYSVSTTQTDILGNVKILSKNLVHGTTYYARARATYKNASGASVNTAYCTPRSFVYDENAGVEITVSDNDNALTYSNGVISNPSAGAVKIYNVAGVMVDSFSGVTSYDITSLPAGIYILKSADYVLRIAR